MKIITRKSLISLIIALIMILNLVPFGAFSQVYATNTYTVTFDLNGGTMTSPSTQIVSEGESPILSEKPTKGTLTLYYWDKNGEDIWNLSELKITEDTTLVARWVTWMGVYAGKNGKVGTSNAIDVEPTSYNTGFGGVVYEGDTNYYWAKPDEGYIFKEWINTTDDTIYSTNNPIMLKSGETPGFNVRAVFEEDTNPKYTVSFNTKGGSSIDNQIIYKDNKVTRPIDPTKEGFAFENWYTSADYSELFDFETPITETTTIYAKWTPTTAIPFTVTFDTNGGTIIPSQQVYKDESPILSQEPTKGTLSLYYWDKNGEKIWDLRELKITEDTTLVARWVTWMGVYAGNNGKVGTSNIIDVEPTSYNAGFGGVVYEGDTNYYWAKPDDGYSFIGWINTSDDTIYSTNNPIMLKSGETPGFSVRAVFESNTKYTITFNSGKIKTTVPNPITVVSGGIFAPPAEPTAQCYDFAGWYIDSELTNIYEFGTPILENTTLYAKWIAHHTSISPVPSKETTCKESGNKAHYKCFDCGKVFKDAEGALETTVETETIPKLEHTWNYGVVTKNATCKEEGLKTYTCTVCGTTITEKITKGAHNYKTNVKKATLNKDGSIATKCTNCGNVKSSTSIAYPKEITLSKNKFTYNKKVQKPTVKVVGSDGKEISSSNYNISYSNKNSKNVGEYTITITFKGNYEGTKSFTYTINPKGTSLSKLKKGKKQFKATWKKQKTQTTGYQIEYSTNKKFKSGNKKVTIKKNKTTSTTVKKLNKNKKYYVRIRTYKTVKGTKYYSDWSKVKNVKVK